MQGNGQRVRTALLLSARSSSSAFALKVSRPYSAVCVRTELLAFIRERRLERCSLPDSYSLEPQETNVSTSVEPSSCGPTDLPTDVGVIFRHSGWQPNRSRIRAALDRCGVPASRIAAWDACGTDAWVLREKTKDGRLKIASCTCKDRFCVPCSDTRSAQLGNRIRDRVPEAGISFLTLTLADADKPLGELIDKIYKSFRRLRTWRLWKDRVKGGVAFLETKWNPALQRWHPHLHVIMEAAFLPQAEISDRWHRVTETSFIVHIKRPPSIEQVIRYVTKYGSKPLDQSFVADDERLDEALVAMRGRHLCLVFGSWRDWALTAVDDQTEWQPIDTLASLLRREARGDPDATAIMEQLRCQTKRPLDPPELPRAPPCPNAAEPEYLVNMRRSAAIAVADCLTTIGTL